MPENVDESLLPHLSAFERIKHLDPDGREWWSARELMLLLTYSKWQDFHKVIGAASEVYRNSGGEDVDAIFMAKRKDSPNASKKYPQLDYELTRHACYLVVLSSDGSKPAVALGKTYFAITTEQYEQLQQAEEDRLRVELRKKLQGAGSATPRGSRWPIPMLVQKSGGCMSAIRVESGAISIS